ncbi:MAG: hypothetical protein H8Z69_03700 [Nanohaloarchaea archaeon]|nr:hypothetical protein [Candidatus Nanohaloarchaea archaeon]
MSIRESELEVDKRKTDRIDENGENFIVEVESDPFSIEAVKTKEFGGEPVYRFFWETERNVKEFVDHVDGFEGEIETIEAYVPKEQSREKKWDRLEPGELQNNSKVNIDGREVRVPELTDVLYFMDNKNYGWDFDSSEIYIETKNRVDPSWYVTEETGLESGKIYPVVSKAVDEVYDHSFEWENPLS